MKELSRNSKRVLRTAFLLSTLGFAHLAYADTEERRWGAIDAISQASTKDRVAYFKEKLTPHRPIRYSEDSYHKKIIKLKWVDAGRSRSAVVNLNRTFDIYSLFEGKSLILSPRARAILDDLGEAITSEGINTRMYAIAGHSFVKGDKKQDQALSMARAYVVKAYLKQKFGIDDKRLQPVGFGSFNPRVKKNLSSPKNNRIELCLIEDVYGFTPKTTVKLPDINSRRHESILISTAGKKAKPARKKLRYAARVEALSAARARRRHARTMHHKKARTMSQKKMSHRRHSEMKMARLQMKEHHRTNPIHQRSYKDGANERFAARKSGQAFASQGRYGRDVNRNRYDRYEQRYDRVYAPYGTSGRNAYEARYELAPSYNPYDRYDDYGSYGYYSSYEDPISCE